MSTNQKFYGWWLLGIIFALDFINMGFPYYGGTVINTYMIRQIPMSRSTLGLGFTLINLAVGLTAPLVAAHIVKFGIRRTFILGSAMVCASSLCFATFGSRPWHYLLAFGVVNGIGVGLATIVPSATLATRWFRRYRGRAMGIALSGSGFAGFGVSWLLDKILRATNGNWRVGWYIVAGAVIVSGIMAALLIKENPESIGQNVDGIEPHADGIVSSKDSPDAQDVWTAAKAFRTSAFWLIAIAGITHTYTYFFFVAHTILYLRGAGISSEKAAFTMGIFTISTLAGRWVGGLLVDFMTPRFAYAVGLSLVIAGSYYYSLVNRPDAIVWAYLAGALYGSAHGWVFTCVATMTGNYYGRKVFPKLYGTMMLLISACASPAGYLGGKVFDVYGSYTPAIIANVILSVIAIAAILFARAPSPPASSDLALRPLEPLGANRI